jgi:hypothetical protein
MSFELFYLGLFIVEVVKYYIIKKLNNNNNFMSQVDIVVFFGLLYQFIFFFILFYIILGIWLLPVLMFIFKTRIYFFLHLIDSILDIYLNVYYIKIKLNKYVEILPLFIYSRRFFK